MSRSPPYEPDTVSHSRSSIDVGPAQRLAPFLLAGGGFFITAAAVLIWETVSGEGPGRVVGLAIRVGRRRFAADHGVGAEFVRNTGLRGGRRVLVLRGR